MCPIAGDIFPVSEKPPLAESIFGEENYITKCAMGDGYINEKSRLKALDMELSISPSRNNQQSLPEMMLPLFGGGTSKLIRNS
jgi:hypothetical protein